MDSRPFELPGHGLISEPELLFHPLREQDRHFHPLSGLVSYGPFSRSLVNHVMDPIRVAIIAPNGESKRIVQLVAELEQRHSPKERTQYLIEYPGFSRIFGLRVVSVDRCAIELPKNLEEDIQQSEKPHLLLAEALSRAISIAETQRTEFDVLLIYLPIRWECCFFGPIGEDFDLHDYLKAITALKGIPSQILREDKVLRYPCRASVSWRLGIALYCKAGGIPWKLANTQLETAYIGISYAVRPTTATGPRFVTCCSQVFDSDGSGLEFIAYETDKVHVERENPYLSRSEMRRVMARSLTLYQKRHSGRTPKQVVVHKTTEFKTDEAAGCFDALGVSDEVELVQIQQDVTWRGISIDPPKSGTKGSPSAYPILRGSYLQLGGREVLLWTQGNAPIAARGVNYFKEGKGIPSPLLLRRFAGNGPLESACSHVLGLTKMNWNNDGLYDRLPVTIGYAHILARTIKRMPKLLSKPYQFRFFM